MDKLSYLLKEKTTNPREIYDTWTSTGSLWVNSKTKIYNKDTIFRINFNTEDSSSGSSDNDIAIQYDDTENPLDGAFVYCINTYTVSPNEGYDPINWLTADIDEIDNTVYFYQGVASPNFKVVMTHAEFEDIKELVKNNPTRDDFIPFSGNGNPSKTSSINISDEEYLRCFSELGIPFLHEEELEYNRDTIIDLCLKPALDEYYSYFPIIIDEAIGSVSANQLFKVKYHTFEKDDTAVAYKAVPYLTVGTTAGKSTYGSGAFNYVRSEFMGMGTLSQWGSGITYRKAVPGYVGMENSDAALLSLATRQGYMNYFRHEYDRDVWENGEKFAQGYTNIGGSLNIHWMCMSKDFSRVNYWHLTDVRNLAMAYAFRKIGVLRQMVKSNDNIPLDYAFYSNRADELEKEVREKWKQNTLRLALAIRRGGM